MHAQTTTRNTRGTAQALHARDAETTPNGSGTWLAIRVT